MRKPQWAVKLEKLREQEDLLREKQRRDPTFEDFSPLPESSVVQTTEEKEPEHNGITQRICSNESSSD